MSEVTNAGLRLKDISDWLKIIGLAVLGVLGYANLTNTVKEHTQQLNDVKTQLDKEESDRKEDNIRMYRKLGAIEFYLCSKDSNHCDPNKN